jgi:hypothetical protein
MGDRDQPDPDGRTLSAGFRSAKSIGRSVPIGSEGRSEQ